MKYLTPQKLASLDNAQLGDVVSSMVLVRKNDKKFLQTVEYLLMRRLHTLSHSEIAKIVPAYCHLVR